MTPNKISPDRRSAMMDAPINALIAFRLGFGREDQYNTLVAATLLADMISAGVPRHRALRSEIKPAFDALNSIFGRAQTSGGQWAGDPIEVDAIDDAIRIYGGLLAATPGPTISRAIKKVTAAVTSN